MIDISELLKRLFKYIFMGVVMAIVSIVIPTRTLETSQIIAFSLTAAATFAFLDNFMPAVGAAARGGYGLGTGLSLSPLFV